MFNFDLLFYNFLTPEGVFKNDVNKCHNKVQLGYLKV